MTLCRYLTILTRAGRRSSILTHGTLARTAPGAARRTAGMRRERGAWAGPLLQTFRPCGTTCGVLCGMHSFVDADIVGLTDEEMAEMAAANSSGAGCREASHITRASLVTEMRRRVCEGIS